MSRDIDPQLLRLADAQVVNIHVPMEVLWDFDAVVDLQKQVLGRMGCQACTSGFDIRWHAIRDWVVSPERELGPAPWAR